jgi:hypothetical protein
MDEILEQLKSKPKQSEKYNKYDGALSNFGTVYKGMKVHRNGETVEERLKRMNSRRALREVLVRKIMSEKHTTYKDASNYIKSEKLQY